MSGIQFGSSNDISGVKSITLDDVDAPSNPADGAATLYKKTGESSLFYLPDSSGPELNVITSVQFHNWTGSDSTDTTFTLGGGQSMILVCVDVANSGGSNVVTLSSSFASIDMATGLFSTVSSGANNASTFMTDNVCVTMINTSSSAQTIRVKYTPSAP